MIIKQTRMEKIAAPPRINRLGSTSRYIIVLPLEMDKHLQVCQWRILNTSMNSSGYELWQHSKKRGNEKQNGNKLPARIKVIQEKTKRWVCAAIQFPDL